LVCLESFDRAALAAIQQASEMASSVKVLLLYTSAIKPNQVLADWARLIGDVPGLNLVLQESPLASFVQPLAEMVWDLEAQHPNATLNVMMPEVITSNPVDSLLLNQSVHIVSELLQEGRTRIFSRSRYYLEA